MRKLFLYTISLCVAVLSLYSCSGDEEYTDTTLTYYVSLDLQGDELVQVPVGTAYTDAGCKAELNGEDYTSKIVTTGLDKVDVNAIGLYTVTYSATNIDGYSNSVERTVAVCNPAVTTDLTGTYTTVEGTYRDRAGTQTPYTGYSVSISQIAPGIFYVSDMFGGYYDQRAGYGSSYALHGYWQLLTDGTLKAISGGVDGWGDSYDSFTGSYDAATGTIAVCTTYAGMDFHVVLQ